VKQVLQNLKSGNTEVLDVPDLCRASNRLTVDTSRSLISAGTERMLLEFGRANLVTKARQQPARVRDVIAKAYSDGLAPTLDAVRSKLQQPMSLGYSNVGVISGVGQGVSMFEVGERVVSNGPHAEQVLVSPNLAAYVPDSVSNDAAAFTVVGSIALQGFRLASPTLGDTVVVVGLGLIGMLTAQIAAAAGCRVIGIDVSTDRCATAQQFGVKTIDVSRGADTVNSVMESTNGVGADIM